MKNGARLMKAAILLRFICQAMGVNYYNPVTQSIVKISGYIIKPFEMLTSNLNTIILFLILRWSEIISAGITCPPVPPVVIKIFFIQIMIFFF